LLVGPSAVAADNTAVVKVIPSTGPSAAATTSLVQGIRADACEVPELAHSI
jgi:hypothetical protein